jgi:hypothetical protein
MSRGNSVSRGEFRLCRRGNSMSRGKFRVEGGIPCRWGNPVSMEFRGHPTVHLVEKNFKKCFFINIWVFSFFFKNALAD